MEEEPEVVLEGILLLDTVPDDEEEREGNIVRVPVLDEEVVRVAVDVLVRLVDGLEDRDTNALLLLDEDPEGVIVLREVAVLEAVAEDDLVCRVDPLDETVTVPLLEAVDDDVPVLEGKLVLDKAPEAELVLDCVADFVCVDDALVLFEDVVVLVEVAEVVLVAEDRAELVANLEGRALLEANAERVDVRVEVDVKVGRAKLLNKLLPCSSTTTPDRG